VAQPPAKPPPEDPAQGEEGSAMGIPSAAWENDLPEQLDPDPRRRYDAETLEGMDRLAAEVRATIRKNRKGG
jgi:hypothetical protein